LSTYSSFGRNQKTLFDALQEDLLAFLKASRVKIARIRISIGAKTFCNENKKKPHFVVNVALSGSLTALRK
jgi:hypothetical protein